MRSLFLGLIFWSHSQVQANSCSTFSAEIIATITSVHKQSNHCYTFLQSETIDLYEPDLQCPLSFFLAQGYPIELKQSSTGECLAGSGDLLSGVLIYQGGDSLQLR